MQEPPEIGDSVYAIGNPRGFEGTFSTGNVSAYRKFGPLTGLRMQLTAPISPGSSGGPVLNSFGEVVGVAVSSLGDSQNINFAVPRVYLAGLERAPESRMGRVTDDVPAERERPSGRIADDHRSDVELYEEGMRYLREGRRGEALDVWNVLAERNKRLADQLFEQYRKSFP
jgi:hypothetical protein